MGETDVIDPAQMDLTLPRLTIVRHWVAPVAWRGRELRAEDENADDSLGTLDVAFSRFNQWYEVNSWWEGHFLERTVPGSFKRTINAHKSDDDPHQMKTLFNHGMDLNVGDKLLGDITDSRETRESPVNTVNVWDTSYNRDLQPGLKRGAYGSSFMFSVTREEWDREPEPSDHNPDGLPERTIRETKTFEAGPVTWPANPGATAQMNSARQAMWSGTDAFYEALAARHGGDAVAAMRQNVIALRSTGRLAAYPVTARSVAADESTDPPAPPEQPTAEQPSARRMSPIERRRRIYLMSRKG